jgi:hypothetical protein
MALHTFGSNAANSLVALKYFPGAATLDTDLGNFEATIASDVWTAQKGTSAAPQVPDSPGPTGVIATGTTAVSATVTAVAFVAGASLATIQPGQTILGANVPAGAYVISFSGTTLVMSAAATAAAVGQYLLIIPYSDPTAFVKRDGRLFVPNRGVLKIRNGDVIARDNTGWPILVSGAAVNYQGSQWTFT